MSRPRCIYLSYDAKDAATATALQQHLKTAFHPQEIKICDRETPIPEQSESAEGLHWVRQADLFIVLFSADYLSERTSIELELARRCERERRPAYKILVAAVRHTHIPPDIARFPVLPDAQQPILGSHFDTERQLQRVALHIRQVSERSAKLLPAGAPRSDFSLSWTFARDHVYLRLQYPNLHIALTHLRQISRDAALKKTIYEYQDIYNETLRLGRLGKNSLAEYLQKTAILRKDVVNTLFQIQENELEPDWRDTFLSATRSDAALSAIYNPNGEIYIPETLNLPIAPGAAALSDTVGLLSYEQKSEFRRQLLLAADAYALEQYGRAHAHADNVRVQIDPQSAQLYEYLLLTQLQREGAGQIARNAAENDRPTQFNQLLLYANRLWEYQEAGKCPTPTALHSLEATACDMGEAFCRYYDQLPDNYLIDTGEREKEIPANRIYVERLREAAEMVFRSVAPYGSFLETLVLELCGGGKFHWIKQVEVRDDHFVFVSDATFEVETNIGELLGFLVRAGYPAPELYKRLRHQLLLRLKSGRHFLFGHLRQEQKRYRSITDPRASLMRFVQSCLMGYTIFGDQDYEDDQSFLRLILEILLPELVNHPDSEAFGLRWFDLDANGEVCAHAEANAQGFQVIQIVEKILRDRSGKVGWLRVAPNIKETIYNFYVDDTEQQYQALRHALQFNDVRRPNALDARKALIEIQQRRMVCYKAYPERGQDFIDASIRELAGEGLMLWLHMNPEVLESVADSVAMGYPAVEALAQLSRLTQRYTEADLRGMIIERYFDQHIRPNYDKIIPRREAERAACIRLLLEAMFAYRIYPKMRYLDFVYEELSEERKFAWIDINNDGKWLAFQIPDVHGFNPLNAIEELFNTLRSRYTKLLVRERIAQNRFQDELHRYYREISEFTSENRLPEREIAVQIIRKLKGIFRSYPKDEFLEPALIELSGKGRIRWYNKVLGFNTRNNFYENQYLGFNARWEEYDIKHNLLLQKHDIMQQVLFECGELPNPQ